MVLPNMFSYVPRTIILQFYLTSARVTLGLSVQPIENTSRHCILRDYRTVFGFVDKISSMMYYLLTKGYLLRERTVEQIVMPGLF